MADPEIEPADASELPEDIMNEIAGGGMYMGPGQNPWLNGNPDYGPRRPPIG